MTTIGFGHNQNNERGFSMKQFFLKLVKDEQGQDLIEYTLLLAFVVLASAALFISAGGSIAAIWTTANTTLANAALATTAGS